MIWSKVLRKISSRPSVYDPEANLRCPCLFGSRRQRENSSRSKTDRPLLYFPSGNKDARSKGKQWDGCVRSCWLGPGVRLRIHHVLLRGRHGHANGGEDDWNSPACAVVREKGRRPAIARPPVMREHGQVPSPFRAPCARETWVRATYVLGQVTLCTATPHSTVLLVVPGTPTNWSVRQQLMKY